MWMRLALGVCGSFSLSFGLIHFFLPKILGYREAIVANQRRLQFGPVSYELQRQDLLGIVWVMNHHASYVLVSIGLLDLLGGPWLTSQQGRWAALWIAGWWVLRSVTQFYLGKRPGDRLIALGFLLIGVVHAGVWLP